MLHSHTWLTRTGIAAVALGLTAALALPGTVASAASPAPSATSPVPDEYVDRALEYSIQEQAARVQVDALMADVRAVDALDGERNVTHKVMRQVVQDYSFASYHKVNKSKGGLIITTEVDTFYYDVNLKKATAQPSAAASAARSQLSSIAEAIAEETAGDLGSLAEVARGDTVKAFAKLYGNGPLRTRVTDNFVLLRWKSEASGFVFEFDKNDAGFVVVVDSFGVAPKA